MSRALAHLIVGVSSWLAPPELRPRFREEWLAELEASADRPGSVTWRTLAGVPRDALAAWRVRDAGGERQKWSSGFLADVLYAIRALRSDPAHFATVILCMGIGLGICVGTFSVLNSYLAGPLPGIEDRDRVARLFLQGQVDGQRWTIDSHPLSNLERLAHHGPAIAGVAGETEVRLSVRTGDDVIGVTGTLVAGDYFAVFGTQPLLGRLLTPADDRVDAAAVVIGERFWQTHLNGSPSVLGELLTIGGRAWQIVGVVPNGFAGIKFWDANGEDGIVMKRQIWLPVAVHRSWPNIAGPGGLLLDAAMRLGPDATREEAEAQIAALVPQLAAPRDLTDVRLLLRPLGEPPTDSSTALATIFAAFMAGPLTVLAIACANVTNLRLARATSRVRELAVRVSLGASRMRLLRLLAIESVMVTVLALAVGWAGMLVLIAQAGAFLPIPLTPDLGLFAFAALLAAVVVAISGVLPAWLTVRRVVAAGVKPHAGGIAHARLRHVLVGAQVALSLALLLIGALFVRSVNGIQSRTPPDLARVSVGEIDLEQLDYTPPAAARFADALLQRVAQDRRIESAAAATFGLFPGNEVRYRRGSGDAQTPQSALVGWVTPGWFTTMALRTHAGRTFTAADAHSTAAVVNERMARILRPDGWPLGMQLALESPGSARVPAYVEVVGVVTDSISQGGSLQAAPAMYLPFDAAPSLKLFLFARTADAAAVLPDLRRMITDVEPRAPWTHLESARDVYARDIDPVIYIAVAINSLGVLALLLAAMGLYAVLAYVVSLRTKEIGVRMAIGARPVDVVRLIIGRALRIVGAGLLCGLICAMPAAWILRSMFVGVSPIDPVALGSASAILVLVSIVSAVVPARRAARIDPIHALRQE